MSNSIVLKEGSPVNGIQNYVVNDATSNKKYTYKIPVENCDRFEKIQEEVGQLYDSISAKETITVKQAKRNMTVGTLIGASLPIIGAIVKKGAVLKRTLIGGTLALVGAVAGFIGGALVTSNSMCKNVTQSDEGQKCLQLLSEAESLGTVEVTKLNKKS